MEPVTMTVIICASVFGVVSALGVFIHLLLISRDKKLNEMAQLRAMVKETEELEKIRKQMSNEDRFSSHYQILGENKESLIYLEKKIDEILQKKSDLIHHYSSEIIRESSAIIAGKNPSRRKENCDRLKIEIDKEIEFFNKELEKFQQTRDNLWGSRIEVQKELLEQAKLRNAHLDSVYQKHSGLVEKVYQRYSDNLETENKAAYEARTKTFSDFIAAPFNFLRDLFKISRDISPESLRQEKAARQSVRKQEQAINEDINLKFKRRREDFGFDEEFYANSPRLL